MQKKKEATTADSSNRGRAGHKWGPIMRETPPTAALLSDPNGSEFLSGCFRWTRNCLTKTGFLFESEFSSQFKNFIDCFLGRSILFIFDVFADLSFLFSVRGRCRKQWRNIILTTSRFIHSGRKQTQVPGNRNVRGVETTGSYPGWRAIRGSAGTRTAPVLGAYSSLRGRKSWPNRSVSTEEVARGESHVLMRLVIRILSMFQSGSSCVVVTQICQQWPF